MNHEVDNDSQIASQLITIIKGPVYNSRENATFLILCRNSDIFTTLETIQNIQDRFNNKFNYDYTFLNDEPFTDEFIYLISSYIPKGNINFGSIPPAHWSYPDHIDQSKAQRIRQNYADIPYGDSESYRHMCRYYSGFFYKHPLVHKYQYYWRIEPGIKYYCDIDYDLFKYMRVNDIRYSFVISLFEYSETIPTLWNHVQKYIMHEHLESSELLPLLLNNHNWYNLCHFWSNFEIANLDIYTDAKYEHFFNYLDQIGGFYYERWGDAPIHSIAISLFLKKHEIHWFDDIGYYHAPYLQCPQDPNVYIKRRCSCDPDEDFTDSYLSCTNHFLNVLAS
ncbi:uncharacterized protein J8A68_000658 [[Candida] subhashii]|uniref:Mannosyltransferase n=1 Tax=[Candida] subhashii TaxID=561895 RepID=A0A8J5QMN9_9ASCO|nr:uncharacterized protein J8A68_000658 [[Candida] subhashii]KAG7665832.1 hypothetical protein J8A68_000658 [[Candida] subhashii]